MSLVSKIQVVPALKMLVEQPSRIDADRYVLIKEDSWTLEYIGDNYSEDDERREGLIYLPSGQRNWAWKNKKGATKMEKLIDSLIHNYPVPSSIVNLTSGRYEIYDGRHRMETIWRFRNNRFTWKGLHYKDLCENDRYKFDNRKIPVTIVYAKKGQSVSVDQLADIFIRLNSGQQLSDSDMFWAYRDTHVMKGVRSLILENARLKAVFGDIDMNYRPDLANWVAYYRGLSTVAGNMSTSYHRASENDGLQAKLDEEAVRNGIDALCTLYERANTGFPASSKELRSYKKIGFVNAFFLADWMSADVATKPAIITKWLGVIGRLRSDADTQRKMRYALHTTGGAQNLTAKKIDEVIGQVNKYLEKDEVDEVDDSDDESV
jgi:hypothetical protein